MKNNCSFEQFHENIAKHKMEVVLDVKEQRHLRFKNNESGYFWFEVVTWGNHLCITGDFGTYVFRTRSPDPFSLFRGSTINLSYWEEKVMSADTCGGIKIFCHYAFLENVKEAFEEFEFTDAEHKKQIWQEVEDNVLFFSGDYTEQENYKNVEAFVSLDGQKFEDFWQISSSEYTLRYQWNCFAIQEAVRVYDHYKLQEE